MTLTTALFSLAIAHVIFAILKYTFKYLAARMERKVFEETMTKVLKEDLNDEILSRIEYVTSNVVSGFLYSQKELKIYDGDGELVGTIRRSAKVQTPRT